ncbi:helix-turn-helix transcriptional regulator [Halalkalibacter urbisdiaboli]|uniref:helix-turn-helix transcriptional regulator n=1 Tax=Halalkalibacter urbisdiaboli TaxID=1960589 RepID=UPI0013FD4209|nr:helix-turn-helix domain-containing protein [Halalkalibacter urbisdiaboli]
MKDRQKLFEHNRFCIELKDDYRIPINFHSHPGYEVVWMIKGEAQYIFEEKVYHMTKGQVLFYNAEELHKVHAQQDIPYERMVLQFDEDFFSNPSNLLTELKVFLESLPYPHHILHFSPWQAQQFQHIMDRLLFEFNHEDNWGQKNALELYLCELFLFICREIKAPTNKIPISNTSSDKVSMLEKVLKELNSVWDTSWTLEEIAANLHLNKFYLCHFFKKEFGLTIQQYIQQRRVHEAKKLLTNTDMTIQDISKRVGFVTNSNFIRSFKKVVHMTPKQYRDISATNLVKFY